MVKAVRMRRLKLALACMTATAGLLGASAQGAEPIYGVWRNPKNTVHVNIKSCGENTCGYIVWASADAQADARKHGTDNLIGLQVLRNFVPAKEGAWRGKVYAPDLGMTFSGTANVVDPMSLKAKGCVIGNFLCKSQTWKRIDAAAG